VAAGSARDKCEWSQALKGAAIAGAQSSGSTTAVIGARGCIEVLQTPNPAKGVCLAGIYRVSVAWQGLHPTVASHLACGQGHYGADDAYRRAIAVRVAIGLPNCS
jgi:type IV pilus assembly protein PilV